MLESVTIQINAIYYLVFAQNLNCFRFVCSKRSCDKKGDRSNDTAAAMKSIKQFKIKLVKISGCQTIFIESSNSEREIKQIFQSKIDRNKIQQKEEGYEHCAIVIYCVKIMINGAKPSDFKVFHKFYSSILFVQYFAA